MPDAQLPEVEFVTSTQTGVCAVRLPEVPVTVTVYVPRVVALPAVLEVVAVSVEGSGVVPVIATESGVRLHPGLVGFESEEVTAQVSETVPVNEFAGVTVIVDVLLVVAPGATVMLAGLGERVKLALPLPPPPPLGGCQKSPHPASKPTGIAAAAGNHHPHFPAFIAAPSLAALSCAVC